MFFVKRPNLTNMLIRRKSNKYHFPLCHEKGKEQALSPDFQGFVTKRQTVYCTRLPPQIPHASNPDLLRRPFYHAHDLRAGVHVERVVVQQ